VNAARAMATFIYALRSKGVVIISTDSYTADEVDLLRGILLDKYGISSTRYSNSKGKEGPNGPGRIGAPQYVIRIDKASMHAPFFPSRQLRRSGKNSRGSTSSRLCL